MTHQIRRPFRRRATRHRVKRIPCEVYSRIVGYLRPVQNWNDAKQVEFEQRRPFEMPR